MPLQEFVKGDRVAYLAKKATGLEACCGNVIRAFRITHHGGECRRIPDTFEAVMEDSGEVMLVLQDRLDFLDGYTGKIAFKTKIDTSILCGLHGCRCQHVVRPREHGSLQVGYLRGMCEKKQKSYLENPSPP